MNETRLATRPSVHAAIALCAAAPLAAQEPARAATLAEALALLRAGDRVVVTRAMGETVRGRVETPAPLALVPDRRAAAPLELAGADVERLVVLRDDPLWNGTLIGLGVGASVVLAADCNSPGCDAIQPVAVPATLALGAGIGLLVDRLHRSELLLFEAGPDRARVELSVVPVVGASRRGLALTLSWGGRPRPRPPSPVHPPSARRPGADVGALGELRGGVVRHQWGRLGEGRRLAEGDGGP